MTASDRQQYINDEVVYVGMCVHCRSIVIYPVKRQYITVSR